MSTLLNSLAILMAYLFGSLSSAIIICKIMGLPDPRTQGSGNPGATNVLRMGGKKAAAITLLGDALKGFIPVLLAKAFGLSPSIVSLIALSAFIGHLFPVFFRFKGGKGVATFLGCLLALSFPTALCWVGTWLFMALLFRYSSLAAMVASFFVPFIMCYFNPPFAYVYTTALMSIILIFTHQQNIKKLWAGKETKIGQKGARNESRGQRG